MIEINPSNFEEFVLNSNKLSLLKFYMPDCPPCKTLDQIILELAPEFENDVNFLQLDATLPSNEPIVFQFKILNVPQILFFKNGNKVDHTLFTNKEKLAKMIEKWK